MGTVQQQVEEFKRDYTLIQNEVRKVIVGQQDVLDGVMAGMLGGGHCLLEGVPGLGKTKMVHALAESLDLSFSRIQFTPDLMPSDIIGTNMIVEDQQGRKHFEFQPGPVFGNILLADEINRATPKTQSALLEAMQEGHVTVAKRQHQIDRPFFVLATQNPLEMEGTYPLPEAQLDRFLFKLRVPFPTRAELHAIVTRTTHGGEATWSCRLAPTPGRSCSTSMPCWRSSSPGPMPESCSNWGELTAPAHSSTSRVARTVTMDLPVQTCTPVQRSGPWGWRSTSSLAACAPVHISKLSRP